MLSTIRIQPHDLKTLFCLQELLISEIVLAEGRVQENKALANKERGKKSVYFRNTRAGPSAVHLLLESIRRCDRIPLQRSIRPEARLLQHT